MRTRTRHILSTIGLVLLLYFIKTSNLDISIFLMIKESIYIPLSLALYLMFFPINAIRMNYLLKSIKQKKQNIKTLTIIEFISKYIYFITPSKLYLPAKAIMLNKHCQIKKSTGIALVSFEYGIDTIATILLAIYGSLFLFRGTLGSRTNNMILLTLATTTALILYITTPSKLIKKVSKRADSIKNKSIKKIIQIIITIILTTRKTWQELIFNKKIHTILIITILEIILAAIVTKLLFLSMSTEVPIYWIIISGATSIFISGISQIPGGIGIREATAVILYDALGIPRHISLIVVIVARIYTIIPLLVGYIYSIKFQKSQTEDHNTNTLTPIKST